LCRWCWSNQSNWNWLLT